MLKTSYYRKQLLAKGYSDIHLVKTAGFFHRQKQHTTRGVFRHDTHGEANHATNSVWKILIYRRADTAMRTPLGEKVAQKISLQICACWMKENP